MILTPDLIKLRLKNLGIRTDKYLGQHFLIDTAVLESIKTTAVPLLKPQDTIVEVGPGLGVLTQELIQLPHPVLSVEKDPILAKNLGQFLGEPSNFTLVQGDILRQLDTSDFSQSLDSWMVVANIPYAITSPLLRKLVYSPNPPHHVVVLVQKEAAQRICAKPGDSARGLLTIQIEIMAESNIVQIIPPTAFWPAPEIESALLVLTVRPQPLVEAESIKAVIRTVIAGFSSKRKQLQNSLAGGLGVSNDTIKIALDKAHINPQRRAETLTLQEWVKLTEILSNSV